MILAQKFAILASSTLMASLSATVRVSKHLAASSQPFLCTRPTISLCVQYLNKHHKDSSPVTREFLAKFENC